jgi:hypothetical protein
MIDEVDNEEIKGIEKTAAETGLNYSDLLPRGYLSVSQITQYLKCGKAYEFRYVQQKQIPSNNFIVQGRGVHKAAEKLHLSIMAQPETPISSEEMVDVYSDSHETEKPDAVLIDADDWGKVKDEGVQLTSLYHKGALGKTINPDSRQAYEPVRPIAAEKVFRVMLKPRNSDPVPFMGVVDIEEATSLSDLKTRRKLGSQADADNSIQLTLYAHVLGKPDVRLDQLVKPTVTIGPRYVRKGSLRTNREVVHALDIVGDVATDIAAGRFSRTNPENWWCSEKWCPYWSGCRGKK